MPTTLTFSNRNRYGGYHINAKNNVIVVTFTGAFNQDLSLKYLQHIKQIAAIKSQQPWALSANFIDYQALTPDAEKVLRQTYIVCLQSNCIADAYCIDSLVGLAQIKKVRIDANIQDPIEKCLFIDEPSATKYLQKIIGSAAVLLDNNGTAQ
ncbi:hypothetical protein QX776_10040 [Alteromonadaceae bacterium BrNp21-10]|nr:hypothetical protein [Alteromonadaceae bacterium BrNp21-10]